MPEETGAGNIGSARGYTRCVNHASRARLLIASLLMVTTIDSAAAVCAYLCAHRNEPAAPASVTASHNCHEVAVASGGDGSLTAAPVRCAPERPALTTARSDAPAFHRAIALDHVVAPVASPAAIVHLVESRSSAPPGAPPGAPLPLRI